MTNRANGGLRTMRAWQLVAAAAILAAFLLAALLSGDAEFMIPVAVLAMLVLGYGVLHLMLTRRQVRRYGDDYEAAASDHTDPIPSTADMHDDASALGDTPETHDSLSPHDIPKSNPGRPEAIRQAGSEDGRTRGNVDSPLDVV